jgi:hypothetical protein
MNLFAETSAIMTFMPNELERLARQTQSAHCAELL